MADTALAEPRTAGAALAAQHGLSVAGTRPGLIEYAGLTWRYRHFITNFSTAGVVASYQKARLGRLWQLLTPLTNALVYYLIFGIILQSTRKGIENFFAYLCIGVFFFLFSSQAVNQGVQSITKNLGLIRALHFPRSCLPISTTFTQLQNLIASVVVLIGIVIVTGEPIRITWLLVIPVLVLQSLFNTGLAMTMARAGNKVTDLKQVMPFITRTWMYMSGVMYAATNFDKHLPPWAATIAETNPLVAYIELARHSLLVNEPYIMSWKHMWALAIAWAVIASIGGFIYFWRGETEYGRG